MSQNKNKVSAQTSALLMVSPQEVGLLGVSEGNLPSLLAVPAATEDDKLLLADIGDVDSFVGQSPVPSSTNNSPNNLPPSTKKAANPESFGSWFGSPSDLSQPSFSNPNSQFGVPNTSATYISNPYKAQNRELAPKPTLSPSSSALPPPISSDSPANKGNQYRNTSKFQRVYATDFYTPNPHQQQQPSLQPNSYLQQPPQQLPQQQFSPQPNNTHPNHNFHQNHPQLNDQQISLPGAPPSNHHHPYQPIQPHWFYSTTTTKKQSLSWLPFSHLDSRRLEDALMQAPDSLVSVVGGRFDVDLGQRRRHGVYWVEEGEVRRATWFRVEGTEVGDAMKLLPCDETFSAGLEEAYKNTLFTSDFHKRLAFQTGESIIIHTPSTIICYPPSDPQHAWANNLTGETKAQVLKRGIEDVENIPRDECEHIDHVVMVVQACKHTSNHTVISNVDAFREVSSQITSRHFGRGDGGRVEFIPVLWVYEDLREDVKEVQKRLKSVTLSGVSKLRHFSNDLLLDLCYFLSPSHAQQAATNLADSLNEAFSKFKARTQSYQGGVSIISHAIGSLLVYELLSKQQDPNDDAATSQQQPTQQATTTTTTTANATTTTIRRNNTTDSLSSISSSVNNNTEPSVNLEDVLARLDLKDFEGLFRREHIDIPSLLLLEDADLKDMGLPLGPRKKIKGYIKQQQQQVASLDSNMQQATLTQHNINQLNNNLPDNQNGQVTTTTTTTTFDFEINTGGVDRQAITYPRLSFTISNLFTLGSPVAFYLTLTGVSSLGDDFQLPTCPAYFNIFHPFDSLAYRMEPMVSSLHPPRPVLIPHHKGRKRMHLELKESLARIGQDLKQRIVESVKSTWNSIHSFAQAHKTSSSPSQSLPSPPDLDEDVNSVLCQLQKDADDAGSVVASSVADDCDSLIGRLNQGRRVDYVLQEKPIEIFNDYLFALSSPSSYWQSEDTALMILKEIYLLQGIFAHKPSHSSSHLPIGPPPKSGFMKPAPANNPPPPPPSSQNIQPPHSSANQSSFPAYPVSLNQPSSQPSLTSAPPLSNNYQPPYPQPSLNQSLPIQNSLFRNQAASTHPPPSQPTHPGYNQFSMLAHQQQQQQQQFQQQQFQQQQQQQNHFSPQQQSFHQHFAPPTTSSHPPSFPPQPSNHPIAPPPSSGFIKH